MIRRKKILRPNYVEVNPFGVPLTIDPKLFDLSQSSIGWLDDCGLTKDSPLIEAKNKMLWGTFGPDGTDNLKWVKLCECDTNHLNNILKGGRISTNITIVIQDILKDRENERE